MIKDWRATRDDLPITEGQRPHFGKFDWVAFLPTFEPINFVQKQNSGIVSAKVAR